MPNFYLRCLKCNSAFPPSPALITCPKCGNLLEAVLSLNSHLVRRPPALPERPSGVWDFREFLPAAGNSSDVVTLEEGGTPLLRLRGVERMLPSSDLRVYLKYEGSNPTGSFKDRGMTVAVSLAKHSGYKAVVVASTGNTSASAAAYASRASIRCVVVLPEGKVAKGKLSQAVLHGAQIIEVKGSFDDALSSVKEALRKLEGLYPLNSLNPWRLEGQKTLAYEIVARVGVPETVFVPVGNAGNISAIWKGFKELYFLGIIKRLPRMIGVQAKGASPLASAWELGVSKPLFVEKPETVATAIRIGKPVNWLKAVKAVKESGGFFLKFDDAEILKAQELLARVEGVGVEPAAASSLAGLLKVAHKLRELGNTHVVVATGHALKDPDAAYSLSHDIMRVEPREVVKELDRLIG